MEYEEFGRKVKQTFEDSKRRYGAVKLCRVLNGAGTPCSIKRVQRYMAEQGLRSVVVKKYSHHADHGSIPDDKVNILKRDFGTETINQKWCTDITYWVFAVRLYLFPQVINHVNNACMAAIAIHVPNGFKYLFLCEDNAGIGSKEYKGTVFKAGKRYFLPILKYPALALPYFQSRKR